MTSAYSIYSVEKCSEFNGKILFHSYLALVQSDKTGKKSIIDEIHFIPRNKQGNKISKDYLQDVNDIIVDHHKKGTQHQLVGLFQKAGIEDTIRYVRKSSSCSLQTDFNEHKRDWIANICANGNLSDMLETWNQMHYVAQKIEDQDFFFNLDSSGNSEAFEYNTGPYANNCRTGTKAILNALGIEMVEYQMGCPQLNDLLNRGSKSDAIEKIQKIISQTDMNNIPVLLYRV